MDKVREFLRVFDEEHGCVVAHEVPVALFGIEFHGKATWVALAVGAAFFAAYCREAQEYSGLVANLAEQFAFGILGDVVGYSEGAVSSRTFGMYDPLGSALAVKMRQLFMQNKVF